jgi:hypothetical protein
MLRKTNMFTYIEENLEKIKNPENVMMIKTMKGKLASYLGAYLKDGESLKITKPKNFMSYPFEPFAYLNWELGRYYWKDFSILWGEIAINKQYLEKFTYCESFEDKKRVDFYVHFDNGEFYMLAQPQRKYFIKEVLPELQEKFDVEIERTENGIIID